MSKLKLNMDDQRAEGGFRGDGAALRPKKECRNWENGKGGRRDAAGNFEKCQNCP